MDNPFYLSCTRVQYSWAMFFMKNRRPANIWKMARSGMCPIYKVDLTKIDISKFLISKSTMWRSPVLLVNSLVCSCNKLLPVSDPYDAEPPYVENGCRSLRETATVSYCGTEYVPTRVHRPCHTYNLLVRTTCVLVRRRGTYYSRPFKEENNSFHFS